MLRTASTFAASMTQVVALAVSPLKAAGFRKRRNSFNRPLERGMTHVLNFQMGPFEPPGTEEIPPFRVNLHGRFTVNVGVFVPEMVIDEKLAPTTWVNEYDCQLRRRLGELMPAATDLWWSLDDPEEAAKVVGSAISSSALPWLERLATRDRVVDEYRRFGGSALGMTPRAPAEIAWLMAETDRDEAEQILREYLASDLRETHRKALADKLTAKGFGHLLPAV